MLLSMVEQRYSSCSGRRNCQEVTNSALFCWTARARKTADRVRYTEDLLQLQKVLEEWLALL
jgi:hypothetical protein